jgi:hypothetical protein
MTGTSEAPAATARVTVYRTDDEDIRQRQVIARVDDAPAATLMFGESHSTEVAAGPHQLKLHNTLVRKKVDFTAAPGEHVEFDVINKPGRLTLGFLSLLGVAPLFLEVRRRGGAGLQTGPQRPV